jgi:hypothetical protein
MKTAKQSFNPDSTSVALLDDASKIVADKTLFINRCIAKAGLEVLESIHRERTDKLDMVLKKSAPPKRRTA